MDLLVPGVAHSVSSGSDVDPSSVPTFLVERRADASPGQDGERGCNSRRDWRRWLTGGSPREILARILPGDPLGLRATVARRLREEALLLDADRVHLRALARCARYAARYEGRPAIDRWLDAQLSAAIEELSREDLPPSGPGRTSAIGDLARPLGLSADAMHRACRAFNQQQAEDRQAFFALVIEQSTLDEIAHRAGISAGEAGRRARRGLDALLSQAGTFDRSDPHLATADSRLATEGADS